MGRTSLQLAILAAVIGSQPATVPAEEGAEPRPAALLKMPGKSIAGDLPELTDAESILAKELRRDVEALADEIGDRNVARYAKLVEAAEFLEASLSRAGYEVERQTFQAGERNCWNLIAQRQGTTRPEEILVVGAHYDSAAGAPGADDNASGAAGVLALARRFAGREPARTLRFVHFANEEPPYFQTPKMGSLVYARRCRQRQERIVGMLCLEMLGYYREEERSQDYPLPFSLVFPSTGNFIGFVANVESGPLVTRVVSSFRGHARFPSEGCALPGTVPGIDWSDHWSFWQAGYPAVMVTDTGPFRYPFYHTEDDTADKLDYERMARVVMGLDRVLLDLARPSAPQEEDDSPRPDSPAHERP